MNQKGFWKGHPAQTPLQRRGESRRGRSMTRPWDYHWDCQWYCQALGLPVVLLGPGTDTNTVRLWDCQWDCQALGLLLGLPGPGTDGAALWPWGRTQEAANQQVRTEQSDCEHSGTSRRQGERKLTFKGDITHYHFVPDNLSQTKCHLYLTFNVMQYLRYNFSLT